MIFEDWWLMIVLHVKFEKLLSCWFCSGSMSVSVVSTSTCPHWHRESPSYPIQWSSDDRARLIQYILLVGGLLPPIWKVSIKLDHFPRGSVYKCHNLWNHHLDMDYLLIYHQFHGPFQALLATPHISHPCPPMLSHIFLTSPFAISERKQLGLHVPKILNPYNLTSPKKTYTFCGIWTAFRRIQRN